MAAGIKNKAKTLIERYRGLSVVWKATFWFLICNILQKSFSFITTPLFTRLMSTEQYGLYSVYLSWLQIFLIFAVFRLDYGVFSKGMSKFSQDKDGYAASMLGLTTIFTSVLLVIYLIFRSYINDFTELSTVIMLGIFAELYFSPAISFWSIRERFDFNYKWVVFVTLLISVLNAALGIIAVLVSEDKGTARILSCVVSQVVVGAVIYFHLMKKGKVFCNKTYAKFAFLFNIPLIPHYFATYVVEQSDRLMIQKLVSISATAFYNLAYTIGGMSKIILAAVNNSIVPLQYRQLENKSYKAIGSQMEIIMLGTAAMAVLFSCIAPEIILFMGGKEYYEAVYIIPPVAASTFFSFLYTMISNVEFYYDKNKFVMYVSAVGALFNVVLNFIAIPVFGYVAAAYTTLFCYIFYFVCHIWYVNHITKNLIGFRLFNSERFYILGALTVVLCIAVSVTYGCSPVRYLAIFVIMLAAVVCRKRIAAFIKQIRQK